MTTPQSSASVRGAQQASPDESSVRETIAEISASLGAFVGRGKAMRQRSKDVLEESQRRQHRDDYKAAI